MRLISFSIAAFVAIASTAQAGSLPEYSGNFVAQTPAGYSDLERVTPHVKTKSGLMVAFGGRVHVMIELSGAHSPVRLQATSPLKFVLRVSSQANDPQAFVQFIAFKSGDNDRTIELASGSAFGGTRDSSQDSAVPFSAKKFGSEYFIITPSSPLADGEYCLSTKEDKGAYCFGIDG